MQPCPNCGTSIAIAPQLHGQFVLCPICAHRFAPAEAESFDPYYTWLGIPPAEQPPNHYRLLGLQIFEENPRVIENAADRQMRHLHALRAGEHAALSQRLLTEVASARICLIDSSRKRTYDEQLRRSCAVPAPKLAMHSVSPSAPQYARATEARTPSIEWESNEHLTQPSSVVRSGTHSRPRVRRRPQPQSSSLTLFLIVFGGIIGLAMGVLAVFYITGHDYLGLSEQLQQFRQQSNAPPRAGQKPRNSLPVKNLPKQPSSALPFTVTAPLNNSPEPEPRVSKPPLAIDRLPSTSALPDATLVSRAPTAINLPPLGSQTAVPLFTLPREINVDVNFVLNSAAADLPAGAKLFLEAHSEVWHISTSNDAATDSKKLELAAIRREGLQFLLRWLPDHPEVPHCSQLSNCILDLRIGEESHVIQLREPAVSSRFVLDLDVKNQEREIDSNNLPPQGKLFLKVSGLHNFAGGAKFRNGIDKQSLDKRLFLEFDEVPGAEVEIKLWRRPTTGHLIVRLEPVFRERGDQEPLTRPRLREVEQESSKAASRGNSDLNTAQSNLSSLNSQLRTALNWQPANPAQRDAKNKRITSLQGQIQRINNNIGDLQRHIAKHQARVAAVPKLRSFMESIHGRASIGFIIGADCGDKDLILMNASGESNDSGGGVPSPHQERRLSDLIN